MYCVSGEVEISCPSWFSNALTMPWFCATPPVITTRSRTPTRLHRPLTRPATERWMPAMMSHLSVPTASCEMTSLSAKTVPKDVAERDVLIVDPMLATGGSAAEAIGEMKKRGCKHIKLMVLVAAPEGIEHIQKLYPDVEIYAGALDDHLNEHGYIVPGLGDAGDRIFGTK